MFMERRHQFALYRAMLLARRIDEAEQRLAREGAVFFHIPGAGHEGSCALAPHLNSDDWLHCHYRQKALLLARGVKAHDYLAALFCNDDSPSRGRQMSEFMSDPALHVLSMVVPTANHALQAVGVAAATHHLPTRPIVVCGIGDGATQQGEFLEAVAQAVRERLPVLFLVEDNRYAISTMTPGRTFFSLPGGPASEYLGERIRRVDGRDVVAAHEQLGVIVAEMRNQRGPALVVLEVERLASHTNADDQTVYRSATELREAELTGDPLVRFERWLLESGVSPDQLLEVQRKAVAEVEAAERAAGDGPQPTVERQAKRPILARITHAASERGASESGERVTMREALRDVLGHRLANDSRVVLIGEDIEDPKGDVFGVTRGLSTKYPGRVRNSPLSESTIVGESIGRALAGERPVAFIQFADFLPPAYNQIVCELASIGWRTDHRYQTPVILMIACGAYRPGLGPFHAQTYESVLAHTPGLDVFMPATAADAAGLLNAAFESGRPTVFLYPKSLLNDTRIATSTDVDRQFTPLGVARKARVGRDITFVAWGNTVSLCERAAVALEQVGVEAEVLDLRTLSPWDERTVIASAEKTARLIVVHEDNQTCGFGAEVLATVAERTRLPVAMRRVTRPDTHIPCHFGNQLELLPTFRRVLTTAAELLNLELSWVEEAVEEEGVTVVDAVGSAPSDETVDVVDVLVKSGDRVERGDALATLEASKSVFDLTAPTEGVVEQVEAEAGDKVRVGKPLLRIRSEQSRRRRPLVQERPGTPVLRRNAPPNPLLVRRRDSRPRAFDVGISRSIAVTGSRRISNAEFIGPSARMTAEDILHRTGIEFRHWAAPGETAVGMAVRAARQVLETERIALSELDLVICSTTSPTMVTPSMACQVLGQLGQGREATMVQAYDINAACSGYLYALQAGFDFLQSRPDSRVLVLTAEVLSPLLNMDDLDTAILFGDASSAAILYGESHFDRSVARVVRPELSAKGEDGSTLSVPLLHQGHIHMKGQKVFAEAVRSMVSSLSRLCHHQGLAVNDLDLVVPHQANQRIIDAVGDRVGVSVYSNIRYHGNTSSTSIPLSLCDILAEAKTGEQLGLCAFGGGFTFGAGILQVL
ncbi:MAG: beta-ketoacyl-ACP synthase 3 [Pirellulales bacterium]